MSHPIVDQLRFTRSEFLRAVKNVNEKEAGKRLLPMNCISWNVGHLAWQEQQYFLFYCQGVLIFPDIQRDFAYGAPGSTPSLKEMLAAWNTITKAADPWLDTLTPDKLLEHTRDKDGKPTARVVGNMLQRVIYHYWYHTGENMAIRQMLGHSKLGVFVGNIDTKAPYRPE